MFGPFPHGVKERRHLPGAEALRCLVDDAPEMRGASLVMAKIDAHRRESQVGRLFVDDPTTMTTEGLPS